MKKTTMIIMIIGVIANYFKNAEQTNKVYSNRPHDNTAVGNETRASALISRSHLAQYFGQYGFDGITNDRFPCDCNGLRKRSGSSVSGLQSLLTRHIEVSDSYMHYNIS